MNLTDINEVRTLQSNLHTLFDTPQGHAVMRFLETSCGWYESVFTVLDKDQILINAGRREVVATIKSLLDHSPEQIVALVKNKEQ